jgi:hypothetical protein
MIGYIETLDKLGCELKDDLAIDVILQPLSLSYEPFIMNYQMNGLEKTLAELHGMLKTTEESSKKNLSHVMMVQKESKKRKRWMPPKGKGKGKDVPKDPSSSKPKPKGKSDPSPDDECFHYKDIGQGTARSTRRISRRRREVRLLVQV